MDTWNESDTWKFIILIHFSFVKNFLSIGIVLNGQFKKSDFLFKISVKKLVNENIASNIIGYWKYLILNINCQSILILYKLYKWYIVLPVNWKLLIGSKSNLKATILSISAAVKTHATHVTKIIIRNCFKIYIRVDQCLKFLERDGSST